MRRKRGARKVQGAATRWTVARWAVVPAVAVAAAVGCGDDGPTGPEGGGPGGDAATEVLVLNSTGQTLARFELTGGDLAPAGPAVDLGAGFDGDGLAVAGALAASSVSSFGGSRLVLVDLATGDVSTAAFPGPDAALVNPSRPTLEADGTLWVGGRGSDAVYRLAPDGAVAERVADEVGRFLERVLPVGTELFVVDANLDDDGGTFAPLGPGRVVVLRRDGGTATAIDLPAGAPNPSDAVVAGGVL
ncbi:MAG: hypothetical protein RRA92_06700, partial [Gemmatimonadota bacterium]|nr:hypothetical protein [Gemmatimonadota bacterium]